MLDVRSYIGIPFKDFGRDHNGVDCWGLLRLIYKEQLGIELPSYVSEYNSTEDAQQLGSLILCHLPEQWREVPLGQEVPGDGVLLRLQGMPMHVGVVVRPGWMIHVHKGIDTCLERYDQAKWRLRITGIYRHEGMR